MEEFLLFVVLLVMFVAPPVFFVICVVNSIIHTRKYKRGEENKTAAVTYGAIAGGAFSYLVVETLLIIWFAEGIAHM
ncbi:MAG: hypothetical protein IKO15_04950 [Clostridiales bacterium]|jgi:hypothetical protein|nr:hypothetical protein [Clostridiales bacterium]